MSYSPKTTPFRHQVQASIRGAKRPLGQPYFMDPGTGKTKAVLDTIGMLAQAGRVQRILVVCPIAALAVWEDEIATHYPHRAVSKNCFEEPILYPGYDADGQPRHLKKNTVFWLINYDLLRYRRRRGKKWVYPYLKLLEKWAPDAVVCDESHRAKRAGSVTATALWRSVQRMRKKKQVRVYLLTGTPNPKGYIDIFAQYRIMDPSIFGTSKADFEERYCQYGQLPYNKFKIVRYLNKDELVRKINRHAYIANENVVALPPRLYQNVRVHLPSSVHKLYEELVEEYLVTLEGGEEIEAVNPAVLRLRLQQITGGFTTSGVQIHGEKVKTIRDLLFDLCEQEEHAVVYARFLPEVRAVMEVADAVGYRVGTVTGSVKERDRAHLVRSFQKSEAPSCLVFQVQTGSLAITLHRAKEVLFYSLPSAWDTYYQCIKRVHRTGQSRAVRIRHLLAPGTVDLSDLQSLKDKSDGQAELMRNPKGYLTGLI